MNVLIAADKFKGSLDSLQVGEAIAQGIEQAQPTAVVRTVIVSDGGDGFLSAIRSNQVSLETRQVETVDALMRPITAEFLWDPVHQTAFVEMAQASGLHAVEPGLRDPLQTSSWGTGLVMRAAVQTGARQVFVGLGGSATNDGGAGMAAACGYRFLADHGQPFVPTGGTLQQITSIDTGNGLAGIQDVSWVAINDVRNRLHGERGAAAVFGPQKGASPAEVSLLDDGLKHLQRCTVRDLCVRPIDADGDGAAGGAGFGLRAFFGATFESGVDFVIGRTGVESRLAEGTIDYLVTGEGQLDHQTADGKLVDGIARLGRRFGVPVIAFCGGSELTDQQQHAIGLTSIRTIHDPATRSVSQSMEQAFRLLQQEACRWATNLRS